MNNKTKTVAVVIPYYKESISKDEEISIKHLNTFLKNYDKFLILPSSVKQISVKINQAKIINFPDEYFISTQKYSELLNTAFFYQKFLNYKYILIYQLDALVLSDQLSYWCNKNYDYIGAPFLKPLIGSLSYKKNFPVSGGNGGFSLRKTESFLKVIETAEKLAKRSSQNLTLRKLWFLSAILFNKSHKIWLNAFPREYPFNEDGFWSYEASKYCPQFKVAPFKEALKFSFEETPTKSFNLNGNKLPFGAHAWAKYNRRFWSKYLL